MHRYLPSQFASQRKLVLRYDEEGSGGHTNFALCNSGDFVENFWLLSCPRLLAEADGGDAASAGCTCNLADTAYMPPWGGDQPDLCGNAGTQASCAAMWIEAPLASKPLETRTITLADAPCTCKLPYMCKTFAGECQGPRCRAVLGRCRRLHVMSCHAMRRPMD